MNDDVQPTTQIQPKTMSARRTAARLFASANRVSLALVVIQIASLVAFAVSGLEVTPFRAVMVAVFVANIYGAIGARITTAARDR